MKVQYLNDEKKISVDPRLLYDILQELKALCATILSVEQPPSNLKYPVCPVNLINTK